VSTKEKRLDAMRRSPRQVRFQDLRAALEAEGFTLRPGKGDHCTFLHPLLPQPVGVDPRRPHVLKVYVEAALRAIDRVREVLDAGGD